MNSYNVNSLSKQPEMPQSGPIKMDTSRNILTDKVINLLIKVSWTMSDMVKYRAALWSFLKLTALVFYHV